MRALEPRVSGLATNPSDGVRVRYEVFGPVDAPRTVVCLPAWSLVDSRVWKMQVPFLARLGLRVVTFDGRGNGGSDRPASGYTVRDFAGDALAVMDDAGVDRAVLLAFSAGARWAALIAVERPQRVEALALAAPSLAIGAPLRPRMTTPFLEAPPDREGWSKYNAHHWREDLPDFRRWFAGRVFTEPRSTKGQDDIVAWSEMVSPETLIATIVEGGTPWSRELWPRVGQPVLIVHGSEDAVTPLANTYELARLLPSAEVVVFEGSGHALHLRDPVRSNLVIAEFIARGAGPGAGGRTTWRRANARRTRRALFVSSPIRLGHAQRDVAIARELRDLVPGLEVDWLAQHPVTRVLEENGERVHPASRLLAGESPHIESLMGARHELNVFQAIRQMDEILLANFHVFLDVVQAGAYDLWVGDEAWEVDYYLHENPELKTAPFAWLTDFVGFLPMVEGDGGREAFVVADYNAEMIEQVERFPRVRDAAVYIGRREDIVPDAFGPGLPLIAEWLPAHFDLNGYVRYFDPAHLGDRGDLRAGFGFSPGERVAVVAVGGTSVGASLLKRLASAFPAVREVVPDLRLVVVCGPRIDPASMPRVAGVEYRGYVHDLYRMLAAADAALVQGGLSTTMELVAARVPFLYFPLGLHFEQNRHVAHRLERYGVPSWARVTYADAEPELLADRISRLLASPPAYAPVEGGGARRAAERIAELL